MFSASSRTSFVHFVHNFHSHCDGVKNFKLNDENCENLKLIASHLISKLGAANSELNIEEKCEIRDDEFCLIKKRALKGIELIS
jgi:hypothetical protein